MSRQERRRLLDSLLDGDISEADFLRLEAELSVDAGARRDYYERIELVALLEAEAGTGSKPAGTVVAFPSPLRRRIPLVLAWAAALGALLTILGMLLRSSRPVTVANAPSEPRASGYAVLVGQSKAAWNSPSPLADGALVPAGRVHLGSGVAQIELFSGVTLVVEGDAEFEIHSPMELSVLHGKIRARVPEPAHGFRIRTDAAEIVDLGTEFAVNVSPTNSEIHVLEGEVEWHPRRAVMRRLEQGAALRWDAEGRGATLAANAAGFVGMSELGETLVSDRKARHGQWQRYSEALRRDSRLVAFYQPGSTPPWERRVTNLAGGEAASAGPGAIVAASRVEDRWGTPGGALDFSPAGSRVRLMVPGEYHSITLLCWVKINSLDRWYNSLFLTDGHELHEPHWQIMDDGRLFFSVKKNDSWNPVRGEKDKHIFHSPPFWNAAMSGQWLMLTTTYDVEARQVTHYLNGRPLSREAVPPEYLVETVSIGAASLGNWGLPERDDPRFAVRNLNGSMDEFALFAGALSDREIAEIYDHARP